MKKRKGLILLFVIYYLLFGGSFIFSQTAERIERLLDFTPIGAHS